MLFKAVFLANQEGISKESIVEYFNDALLASKFLRSALANYEIFMPPEDKVIPAETRQML